MMKPGDRVAAVWEFFDHENGKCRIDGCTYKPLLVEGKPLVPTNLKKHLELHHKKEYEIVRQREREKSSTYSFKLTGKFGTSVLQAHAEVATSDAAMLT